MPKIIDIRDFHAERLRDMNAPAPAVRFATTGAPVASAEERTITFVFSDESVDRYGDVIFAKGWDLTNFSANPVALFGHDAGTVENVIGRAKNVRVEGARLVGDIEFMGAEVNPNAEAVYQMVKGGYLKTVSVGFQPTEWEFTKDKSRPGGVDFKKQELLEISIVPIPANPKALIQAKAAGIDLARLGLAAPAEGVAPNLRALAKTYRRRGLYELSSLCDLVNYAEYVCCRIEQEGEDEGDASPLPARMRAWMDEGNRIITALAQEETAENAQGTQDPDVEGRVDRGVRRALAALGLTKSGKAISAANEKCLRVAHAHITEAASAIMNVVDPQDDPEADEDDDDNARALRARKARAWARKAAAAAA
ncbi:MAG TPA: HK97 family phage prohead protease [Rhodoblastus sp.]|nr:HK97 family phage prohead protease [Rhodoblastus sp.]